MYKQSGLQDLILAVAEKVEEKTGISCYDVVPEGTAGPFYIAEIAQKRCAHTKTMFRDIFTVWIRAVAEPEKSLARIYELMGLLEEALTEDITLPDGFTLVLQANKGIQKMEIDETHEKHMVAVFEFTVCYNFECKA